MPFPVNSESGLHIKENSSSWEIWYGAKFLDTVPKQENLDRSADATAHKKAVINNLAAKCYILGKQHADN